MGDMTLSLDSRATIRKTLINLDVKMNRSDYQNFAYEDSDDSMSLIHWLIEKLEKGSATEKKFAKQTIVEHLPAIYKAVVLVAKDLNVPLPKPETIK